MRATLNALPGAALLATLGASMLAGLVVSVPAYAGGIGVLGAAGARTERVFFYSSADTDTLDDAEPLVYTNIRDYEQFSIVQNRSHFGGGLELLLGDRDDMITGSFRAYYQQDAAQVDPATQTAIVDPDYVVAAYREDPRHLGIGVIGLNFGLVEFADDRFRFGFSAHIGSGFVTLDHTEFFMGSVGPSITYKAARQVHVFADVVYQARVRQVLTNSGNVYVGARYFFD